jgi:hypothetical protein
MVGSRPTPRMVGALHPAEDAASYRSVMDLTAVRERLRRVPAPLVDAALAVAAAATAAAVGAAVEPHATPPNGLAYLSRPRSGP